MEPMAIGSPSHSPSGSPGGSFLPPYLMGEFHQPITPRAGSLSPTKARTLTFGSSPSVRPSPPPQQFSSTPLLQKTMSGVSFSKPNGPPTQGLFDTLSQSGEWSGRTAPPTPFTSPTRPAGVNQFYHAQESVFNDTQNQSALRSRLQNLQNVENDQSVCYSSNLNNDVDDNYGDEENQFWVTVFGFPSSAAGLILTQFSNCGNIIEKKFPSQGNWVWLRFSSRSDVGRALALNGRILSGGVMIGVMQCSHPHSVNHHVNRSGARQLAVNTPRLPLNATAASPTSPSNTSVQRSSGAISRALEYVFGW